MITVQQEREIREITKKYNPVFVGVFGSYARNEQTEKSDLDILIDFKSKINLLELVGLEQELSKILRIKVDLVTLNSVNEKLKPYIEQDLIRII